MTWKVILKARKDFSKPVCTNPKVHYSPVLPKKDSHRPRKLYTLIYHCHCLYYAVVCYTYCKKAEHRAIFKELHAEKFRFQDG